MITLVLRVWSVQSTVLHVTIPLPLELKPNSASHAQQVMLYQLELTCYVLSAQPDTLTITMVSVLWTPVNVSQVGTEQALVQAPGTATNVTKDFVVRPAQTLTPATHVRPIENTLLMEYVFVAMDITRLKMGARSVISIVLTATMPHINALHALLLIS